MRNQFDKTFYEHSKTSVEASVEAIATPDIEVRIEIDNFDEFENTYKGVLLACRDAGKLDEEKTIKAHSKEESLLDNPTLVVELKNGSAIVFKMTDRALAQMAIQQKIDRNPGLGMVWALADNETRERLLQDNIRGLKKLREQRGFTPPTGPAVPGPAHFRG